MQLGGVLHNEQTVDRVLELVTVLTERTVRSASSVSVTLVNENGAPFTSNARTTVARELDEVQYRAGAGPCLEALGTQRPINAVLARSDGQWLEFKNAATDSGMNSILSLPLAVQERTLGGLNIYSADDLPFNETETAPSRTPRTSPTSSAGASPRFPQHLLLGKTRERARGWE